MLDANLPAVTTTEDIDLDEKLGALIGKFEREARDRVNRRATVELRWIEGLEQYHGQYDATVSGKIKDKEGSEVFINLVATKTDAMEARLWDLLFPTDDRNWGINPTPVPELSKGAEEALAKAKEARTAADQQAEAMQQAKDANQMEQAQQAETRMRAAEDVEISAQAMADQMQEQMGEASRRAALMQEEIDDQLTECSYASAARDAISDACKLGLGVLKGPLIGDTVKRRWVKDDATGEYMMVEVDNTAPGVRWVDPWAFFPDPDVRKITDSEVNIERHLMTKAQLRKLAKQGDINPDAVREILKMESLDAVPAFLSSLHALTGQTDAAVKGRYTVWERRGPIDAEDLALIALNQDDPDLYGEMMDADPLEEVHATVMFCQGKVLSFALHPLDSGECIYSTFTIRPDEASIYGYGIPWIMQHPMAVLNGAMRMMMDNAALSTGPQIVVDKDKIVPADGDWTLRPNKVWHWKSDGDFKADGKPPFYDYAIDGHQNELSNIITLAAQMIDEVTAMPAISQGEQGAEVTKTATGMTLLMNSANVTFRRIVKNWDDDMTVPIIRRLYHFNMQFSDKDAIKGDYEVKARGSSVLLVREMQAQNLMAVAQLFGDHAIYGEMLKHRDLMRQIFRAHNIAADEIVKTQDEMDADAAAKGPDPAALEAEMRQQEFEIKNKDLESRIAIAQMETASREKVAQLNFEASMNKLADQAELTREQLDARIAQGNADNAARERNLAVEAAMAVRTGKSSGGAV